MVVRALPWLLRAAWALLPVTAGPVFADALTRWPTPGRTTVSVALWVAWAVVLVAVLVPHPGSLTLARIAGPAATAFVAAAGLASDSTSSTAAALGVGVSVVATAVAALPEIGAHFVNGPAYPNERRLPLRAPAPVLAGPIVLAWMATVAGPAAVVVFAAKERWLAAAIAAVVGLPVAGVCGRALYGLARRWVVFVPAGLVLHDHMVVADPVLFRRQVIESLHAAPADTDSLDLTANAPGLALELVLTEKVPMTLVRPRRDPEAGSSARLLFTPTRPGAVLTEARTRRIPVG